MFTKAIGVVASVGLAVGGLLAVGPVQAEPRRGSGIDLPSDRYWYGEEACHYHGQRRVQSGSWKSYDCVMLWNASQTVFIYWLEQES